MMIINVVDDGDGSDRCCERIITIIDDYAGGCCRCCWWS